MDLLEVGSRCRMVRGNGSEIVGKITASDGATIDFMTPHGTTIKTGIVWAMTLIKPLDEASEQLLQEYEESSAAKLGTVYGQPVVPYHPV